MTKRSFKERHCPVCGATSKPEFQVEEYTYLQCSHCAHLFISDVHAADFNEEFYNSERYKELEKIWKKEERLSLFTQLLYEYKLMFGKPAKQIVDFGSGDQDLDEKRRLAPGSIHFYDPYYKDASDKPFINNHVELTICTEVLEHVFDPYQVLKTIFRNTKICFATTLCHDFNFDLSYLNPYAGHVSIFSTKSMHLMAENLGIHHEFRYFADQGRYYFHVFRT